MFKQEILQPLENLQHEVKELKTLQKRVLLYLESKKTIISTKNASSKRIKQIVRFKKIAVPNYLNQKR